MRTIVSEANVLQESAFLLHIQARKHVEISSVTKREKKQLRKSSQRKSPPACTAPALPERIWKESSPFSKETKRPSILMSVASIGTEHIGQSQLWCRRANSKKVTRSKHCEERDQIKSLRQDRTEANAGIHDEEGCKASHRNDQ